MSSEEVVSSIPISKVPGGDLLRLRQPDQPKKIYRYEVPVDGRVHPIELGGDILHVAARDPRVVEFWALHGQRQPGIRRFRVYGTGQPLPIGDLVLCGTAIAGPLVWHLIDETYLPAAATAS